MRYLSIFFEIKDSDRTNAVSDEVAANTAATTEEAGMKVRSVPLTWNFKLPRRNSGVVFNGEFDSGSERTLAAWIRHASRARFFPVAIQGNV